jgi:succinate-acetate transporter protein
MMLGGLLEFLLGNTYSFVNFCGYGGWWWTFGATLQPFFGAYAAYSPDPSTPRLGLENPEFNASFGKYPIAKSLMLELICWGRFYASVHGSVLFLLHPVLPDDKPGIIRN